MAKVIPQISLFLFITFLSNSAMYGQIDQLCRTANPFCSDAAQELTFPNTTGDDFLGLGQIGCLNTSQNASWYFIRIEESGRLEFDIQQWMDIDGDSRLDRGEQQLDVDFIAWGPFTTSFINCDDLATGCDLNGDTDTRPEECVNNADDPDFYIQDRDNTNIVDCSYAFTPVEGEETRFIETLTITDGQSGEYYIILVTNDSDESGVIQLQQTNLDEENAGTTDCSVLEPGVGPDIATCGEFPVTIEGRFPRVVGPPEIPAAIRFQWERAELGTTNFSPLGAVTDTPVLEVFSSGVYQLIGYSDTMATIEVGRDDLQVLDVSAIEITVDSNVAEESFAGSYTVTAQISASFNNVPDVQVLGFNDFEYRLDRDLGNGFIEYRAFQSSPVFSDVHPGDYRITARYRDCPASERESSIFMILGYPKYFTPNGDSFHDTWNIINPELSSQIPLIYIFDRYGKLLKQLRPDGAGWDGTYNGKNMPSSEYWFRVEFNEPTDPNMRRRVFAGSFSLIR